MTASVVSVEDSNDKPGIEPRALSFWSTFAVLYLFAAALLAWRLGSRPEDAYNWEAYTLRGLIDFTREPTWDVFRLNDGLMTDSGRSATVVGPGWVGFQIFGQSLLGLRFPIVLISAFSVPLTWVLGRRLYSDLVGIAAALLVATSPVFLLYGRTGTIVGMSVAPALIGMLVLWNCLRPHASSWWRWLIVLQAVLIALSYFYGVIRFLWIIALVLFVVEFVLRSGERRRFLASFALTVVVLPIALLFMRPGPMVSPTDVVQAVELYYSGRGEQILQMAENNESFLTYLRVESEAEREELLQASRNELIRRLIEQNSENLGKLLTDQETRPAVTDFWNSSGRLYPAVLVPLFLIGTGLLIWRSFRDPRARMMLALFWGYSLPMILTSNVHIGRLVFIVPLLSIIVALPALSFARWLSRRQPPDYRPMVQRWASILAGTAIVLFGASENLDDWTLEFPRQRMDLVADQIVSLTQEPPTEQLVYVFGDGGRYEIESLGIAELEVQLDGYLRFVDLRTGITRGNGPIPLLYGSLLERIGDPESVPGYCTSHYLVDPSVVDQFLELTEPVATSVCGAPLRYDPLAY